MELLHPVNISVKVLAIKDPISVEQGKDVLLIDVKINLNKVVKIKRVVEEDRFENNLDHIVSILAWEKEDLSKHAFSGFDPLKEVVIVAFLVQKPIVLVKVYEIHKVGYENSLGD